MNARNWFCSNNLTYYGTPRTPTNHSSSKISPFTWQVATHKLLWVEWATVVRVDNEHKVKVCLLFTINWCLVPTSWVSLRWKLDFMGFIPNNVQYMTGAISWAGWVLAQPLFRRPNLHMYTLKDTICHVITKKLLKATLHPDQLHCLQHILVHSEPHSKTEPKCALAATIDRPVTLTTHNN